MKGTRRDALAVIGASATTLGSMLGVTMGLSPSDATDDQSQSTSTGQLRYQQDTRKQACTSGSPLSAVSGFEAWTATNGSVSTTGWNRESGNAGVRLNSPRSATRTSMHTTFTNPLDLTSTALSLGIRLNRAAEETIKIRLLAPDEQHQLLMERYLTRDEGTLRLEIAPGQVTGSPDPADIRGVAIEAYTGSDKPLDLHVGAPRVRELPSQQRGAVILTFDDGHHTVADAAKPVMDRFGYPGVVGVIPKLVGQNDRLSRQQLHTMVADGWEMASHPQIPETPLPTLSKSRQRTAIERTKQWLLDEGFDRRGETLIWPFGRFDKRTLALVGKYHRLAFGGGSSPAPWTITEPGWVPRINGDNPKKVQRTVDMAAQFGTVATVMYHTIGQSRLSTAAFRNELRYINQADVDVIVPSTLADAQPY